MRATQGGNLFGGERALLADREFADSDGTDGGSHAIVTYRLHPHFELSLPIGRTFDALTGEEWEGRGVTPDMECLPEQALQVALDLALHKPTPFV